MLTTENKFILIINCPDKEGIIATVSNFLFKRNFNILESSQFKDTKNNQFFMRVCFTNINNSKKFRYNNLQIDFEKISKKFKMQFDFYDMSKKQKVLIMVSKFGHCLNHILYQWKTGSLNCEIPLIVSNHSDMKEIAKPYRIKYNVININKTNKQQQEKRLYNLIEDNKIDLVVLARYMQVLSPEICKILEGKIINIHHSFLPSFKGARPYNQAFLQGVKIIGATAHYVNEKLDEGQIIEQDVARVDHTKTLENFISIGRDIENLVLKNALNWHLERRVIINENRTIVFN
ncbi:formyltetrahydrofolate deformylase [Pelagibacteraceae bacterium]|nr:formyltetrahydrofolate deformylase [Pelagibacteraceae bacterium]